MQRKFFKTYLNRKKLYNLEKVVKGVEIRKIDVQWKTSENINDCGVFLMRHMETYFGQKPKDWDIGLTSKSVKNVQILRGKYCRALMGASFNHNSLENKRKVLEYFKKNKGRKAELDELFANMVAKY